MGFACRITALSSSDLAVPVGINPLLEGVSVNQQFAADGKNAAIEPVHVTVEPKPTQRAFGHRRICLGV
jgi:hypothetical protein